MFINIFVHLFIHINSHYHTVGNLKFFNYGVFLKLRSSRRGSNIQSNLNIFLHFENDKSICDFNFFFLRSSVVNPKFGKCYAVVRVT